jgi:hypothetical protein
VLLLLLLHPNVVRRDTSTLLVSHISNLHGQHGVIVNPTLDFFLLTWAYALLVASLLLVLAVAVGN